MIETMIGVIGGFLVGCLVGWVNNRDLNKTFDKTVSYYKETIDLWRGVATEALAQVEFWELQFKEDVGEETTWH
jgi:glycogen synthase